MALWPPTQTGIKAFLRWAVAYSAALLLPWLAAGATIRLGLRSELPGAFLLLSVGLVASLWGFGPAAVSLLEGTLLFNNLLTPPYGAWSLSLPNLVHSAAFLAIGSLVAFFSKQRKSTEAKLRVALATLQEQRDALVQAQIGAKAAAWIFTTADRRTRWFPGGPGIFGRSYEEITEMGSPVELIEAEDQPKVAEAAARTIQSGVAFHVQFRVRWPNGEIHWLEANGTPLIDNPSIWRGVTIDITERKNAEAALIRAEKLAAAGRLASTIAHEINNPLEAISNLLYLVQRELAGNPVAQHHLELAEKEITRLSGISRLTLNFVRKPPVGPVVLATVMDGVLDLFEGRCYARGIHIKRAYTSEAMVAIPADQVRQIFANLISNAFDAAHPDNKVLQEIAIEFHQESEFVMIQVADSGTGIPAEILSRIFDPFFTTKDDTGTGIGLWVAKELIEKYGGTIAAESGDHLAPYRTRFQIRVPSFKV